MCHSEIFSGLSPLNRGCATHCPCRQWYREREHAAVIQCFSEEKLLIHLQVKTVFCMVPQFQINELRLGGVSYERGALIGG